MDSKVAWELQTTVRTSHMNDEKPAPSFRESADYASEIIAESPTLKAILNAVPYVGGSLSELFAGRGSQIMEERKNEFLLRLSHHMETLEAEAVKKEYFSSPEGFDLLLKALDSAGKTRSEYKTDLYARILAGATRVDKGGFSSAEEYLHMITDLTPKEVEVARWMFKRGPTVSETELSEWPEHVAKECGIDVNDLFMILSRLEARGLVNRVTSGVDENGFYISSGLEYGITTAFEKLMDLVGLDQKNP